MDVDSSSTKSGRRPSVDTVSTYLSHETPVDLLDSSVGSDDPYKDSILGMFKTINLHLFSESHLYHTMTDLFVIILEVISNYNNSTIIHILIHTNLFLFLYIFFESSRKI